MHTVKVAAKHLITGLEGRS